MNTSTVRGRSAAGTVTLWLDLQDSVPEGTRLSELSALSAAGTIAAAGLGPDTGVAAARQVCDALRPLHDRTGGRRGTVVLTLPPSPDLPFVSPDAAELVRGAAALAGRVDRTNQVVALPANGSGVAALEDLLARDLPVHLATCFSARRYEQAATAYLSALTRARAEGRDLAALASTVAFGLRPLDIRIDALLDRAGGEEAKALRGTAALLAARLARRASARIFDPRTSPEWEALAAAGARPLRLVWTELGDLAPAAGAQTDYAAELADVDTAFAVPVESLGAAARLRPGPQRSDRGLAAQAERFEACLRWFGIRTEEVVRELEGEPAEFAGIPRSRALVGGGVS
ncbi:transaldolase family protein [Streptomyces sp. NPDC058401]|uniref:transaldolase family protein n=1 Tax=Streptomyces sp. NPDC058401 TaxID=3346480 RepID=UPI003669957A